MKMSFQDTIREQKVFLRGAMKDYIGFTTDDASWEIYVNAFSSTLAISLLPFFLLFLIPIKSNDEKNQSWLRFFLSIAAGGLLGDAFLHLLPHAIVAAHEAHHEEGGIHGFEANAFRVSLWTLSGIFIFFLVEIIIRLCGTHSHETKKNKSKSGKSVAEKPQTVSHFKAGAYLNLAADFLHNFTDGLAIGSSFMVGEQVGLVTTFTICLHEFPHEVGDFALLIESGYGKWKAIFMQLMTAVGALAGCTVALVAEQEFGNRATEIILPLTAGGFIYVALVSIVSELLDRVKSVGQTLIEIIAVLLGFGFMLAITYFEAHDHGHGHSHGHSHAAGADHHHH